MARSDGNSQVSYGERTEATAANPLMAARPYNGSYDVVTFYAEPGHKVHITVEGQREDGTPDLAVTLVGPNGEVVSEQLDDGKPCNAVAIEGARLIAGGTYTVAVWSERGRTPFSYDVTVENVAKDTDGDGFTDYLERNGVPIGGPPQSGVGPLSTPVEIIQRSDGGAAVTTIGGANQPNAVRLDPTSADTDDDGRTDSEEIGSFVTESSSGLFGAGTTNGYYTYNSNPVDPNSDNVGLNDSQEIDRFGTDPNKVERSLVMAKLPTRADEDSGTITDVDGGWKLAPAAATTITGSTSPTGPVETPKWLKYAYNNEDLPDTIPREHTYALVDVAVYVASENASTTPYGVAFDFTGEGEVVAAGTRPKFRDDKDYAWGPKYVNVDEGVNMVSMVVKTDAIGPRSPGKNHANVGKLRLSIRRPQDSPFRRQTDTVDADGRHVSTITSEQDYTIPNSGAGDVGLIYHDGVERLEEAAIQAITLQVGQKGAAVEGGAEFLLTTGAVSGGVVEAAVITIQSADVICGTLDDCPGYGGRDYKRIPAGPGNTGDTVRVPTTDTRRSTIAITQYESQEIRVKKKGTGNQYLKQNIYYKYTGVSLIRQN